MKIVLLSTDQRVHHEVRKRLEPTAHQLVAIQSPPAQLRAVVEQERPDLVLLEGDFDETSDLAPIEAVTAHGAGNPVFLLCANQGAQFLMAAMRAGVREVIPVPLPHGALEAAVARQAAKLSEGQGGQRAKVLAFMSCKGGSGATFLATNLGYLLAESCNVLLIDLNLQFGDALSFVHDGPAVSTLADVARDIRRLDASFLAASAVKVAPGFSILAAPDDPAHALEIKPEHVERIVNVAAAHYDFVLMDLGRSIDPVCVKAMDCAHRIFPVLQAEVPHLRNAKKLLEALAALGYADEKSEPIVNRFSRKGEIGLDEVRRLLGRSRLHTVPNSYREVSASINQGYPLIKTARSSAVSRILVELTRKLHPVQAPATGLLGRLFRRA